MAKAVTPPEEIRIGLYEPGLTPFLRAGLGGLAASIHAIAAKSGGWPGRVEMEGGSASVLPDAVLLHWGKDGPARFLDSLITQSFRLENGQVFLPGAYGGELSTRPHVVAVLQAALRRSFLGHPKFVTASGRAPHTFEIDGRQYSYDSESLRGYIHQQQAPKLSEALKSASRLELASWAYPGAAQRHIAFPGTKATYAPAHALAAVFALVGCLVYLAGRGAAVVLPSPADLVAFGEIRARLTPGRYELVHVAGVGDAVLSVNTALRLDEITRRGHAVSGASAILLGTVAWDKQRRVRVATVNDASFSEETLDLYYEIVRTLPAALRGRTPTATPKKAPSVRKAKRATTLSMPDGGVRAAFVTVSALRGFVTENIARGRPWYDGFATATDGGDPPRWIHCYHDTDRRNLGALWPGDREGLRTMAGHLDDAEEALVTSVHDALRSRFAQIAEETHDNPVAMKNRWAAERQRWRLAFAGAKTHEQVRAALADLWSRGGRNAALQERWPTVLPLLRPDRWRAARDLALVGLASYASREADVAETDAEPPGPAESVGLIPPAGERN